MGLGYTIATILKRSSHVFSDERIIVKIDWLEQLNRKYIQVLDHLRTLPDISFSAFVTLIIPFYDLVHAFSSFSVKTLGIFFY